MVNGNSAEKREVNMKNTGFSFQDSGFSIRKTNNVSILRSEKGIVLVVSLLLLLVATVVGITALSTSTTNVMMTGNQLLSERAFAAADSGIFVTDPIIDDTAYNRAVSSIYTTAPALVPDPTDFIDEITGALVMDSDDPITSPDIQYTLGAGATAITVSVDVDYLYSALAAGSAIEFASGYEGMGKGAGAGGVEIYYAVLSVGQGTLGSESEVCSLYKYVPR